MQRILLISPPAPGLKDKLAYPPLGLLYLASNLEGERKLEILNMTEEHEQTFIKPGYDVYGISIHSVSTYEVAKRIADGIKKIDKNALIVAGGSFPTSMPEFTLQTTEIDVIVRGEGEAIFSNIVNLDSRERLKDVLGVTHKTSGKIFKNPPEKLIENLDLIKFPARHLLPKSMIRYTGEVHHSSEPATTILATRGCPWSCYFCDKNIWSTKWRCRSPQNIKDEIELMQKEYDIHWIRFPDDNLTLNRKWFIEFCQKIAGCKIKWTCLSRGDTLDLEMLKIAKDSGCTEMFFGFESGSQRLLDAMNKKALVTKNARVIEMCKAVGITSCAYMMFGFPGEDEKTVEETIQFLLKTKPDKSRLSTFIAIPGTNVWDNPTKYNIRIKQNFTDYWYFDDPESGKLHPFSIEYDYLPGGNTKMEELRQRIIRFYKEEGYFEGWAKPGGEVT